MALALDDTIKFEWDSSKRSYMLELNNQGREVYAIRSNGKISYYPWASPGLRWMICDRNDCAFNVRKMNCSPKGADSCEQLSDFFEHPKNPGSKQEGFFDGEECSLSVEVIRGDVERAREIERELKQYILKMEEE